MPITMRDVAERAEVSKATVSYILNGRQTSMRIPEETRQRVLAVVRGLPSQCMARGVAHKQTDTIAVVRFLALLSQVQQRCPIT